MTRPTAPSRPRRAAPARVLARVLASLLGTLLALASPGGGAAEVARFVVEPAPAAPPAAAVSTTLVGGWAGSDLVRGGDFEPLHLRDWVPALRDAPEGRPGRAFVALRDATASDTLREGAFDGAEVTVLRLEGGRLRVVREGRVPPGGGAASGWQVASGGNRAVPGDATSVEVPVRRFERPGRTRWYALRAVDGRGRLSPLSEVASVRLPDERVDPERRRMRADRLDHDAPLGADGLPGPATGDLAAPAGLSARATGQGTVRLDWDPPAGARPAGYVVLEAYVAPSEMRGAHFDVEVAPGAPDAPIRAGDRVVLRRVLDGALDRGALLSDRVWDVPSALRPAPLTFWPDERADVAWRLRRHPLPEGAGALPDGAADGGGWRGRSYLEVDLTDRARAEVGLRANHAGTGQDYYEVLRPGVAYRVSVRLRGERAGRAVFRLTGLLGDAVRPVLLDYGTEWTHAEATFTVPRILERPRAGSMVLVLQGPGRVDVDALRVHRADSEPGGFPPEDRARLAGAQLSALRTHGLVKTGRSTYDGAALLGAGPPAGRAPGLPRELETMAGLGAAPWLQVEPHLTDAEWLALVEWLAAPAPGPGEAAARPWAALRAAQGRQAPWAEAFETIYLEIGNETWNGLFAPWTFFPMTDAATGERAGRGTVYGLFQARVAEVMRSSPWWDEALEARIVWVIGGHFVSAYGEEAAAAAPEASDLVTIAAYNGGWDADEGAPDGSPESVFNLLNQVSQSPAAHGADRARAIAGLARRQGRAIRPGTYEAGPGYVMDGLNGGRVSDEEAAAQERVMKSAAAGASTLDSFLTLHGLGYGMQNFFAFGEGVRWSSHAPWHRGGAPYPAWDWLATMNRLGWGEALAVRALAVPRADLAEFGYRRAVAGAPLIGVHALRGAPPEGGGTRLLVAAVSRRAPGHDDGAPASDGANCTPVEVALPLDRAEAGSVRTLTLHRSDGPPDAHGARGGTAPRLEAVPLDPGAVADGVLRVGPATGAPACGLPAATALLYEVVLDGTEP